MKTIGIVLALMGLFGSSAFAGPLQIDGSKVTVWYCYNSEAPQWKSPNYWHIGFHQNKNRSPFYYEHGTDTTAEYQFSFAGDVLSVSKSETEIRIVRSDKAEIRIDLTRFYSQTEYGFKTFRSYLLVNGVPKLTGLVCSILETNDW